MSGITITNVSFTYPDDLKQKLVLKDIDLEVESGEFVCLLGQSGCGKSTLLRLLAGLEKPTTGQILQNGEPVTGAGMDRGVVFQNYGLFPWMTAGENIMLALKQKFKDKTKAQRKEIAMKALRAVGLDDSVYSKLPKELSGGMKQRCAIAQAFSINPPALLMDEPFGALDAVTRARLQDMVLDLWGSLEQKKTVFFVTHDVDEALLLATRICVLGQAPSKVIYDVKLPLDRKPTRDTLFEDVEMMKLRNELIRQINKDVASRIE